MSECGRPVFVLDEERVMDQASIVKIKSYATDKTVKWAGVPKELRKPADRDAWATSTLDAWQAELEKQGALVIRLDKLSVQEL